MNSKVKTFTKMADGIRAILIESMKPFFDAGCEVKKARTWHEITRQNRISDALKQGAISFSTIIQLENSAAFASGLQNLHKSTERKPKPDSARVSKPKIYKEIRP